VILFNISKGSRSSCVHKGTRGWVFSDIASVCANDGPFCLEKKIMDHVPVVFQQGQAPWSLVKSDMIKTTWNDIGGLAAVKKCLREMILWPKM